MTDPNPLQEFQQAALWAAVNYLPLHLSFKTRLGPRDEWVERSFSVIFSNGMAFSDEPQVAELLAAAHIFQYEAMKKNEDSSAYSLQDLIMFHMRGAIILKEEMGARNIPSTYIAFQETIIGNKHVGFHAKTLAHEENNTDIHADSMAFTLRHTITHTEAPDDECATVLFMGPAGGNIWDSITSDIYQNLLYFRAPNKLPCIFMQGALATYHSAQVPASERTAHIANSGKFAGLQIKDFKMEIIPLEQGPKNMQLILGNRAYMESKAHFRRPQTALGPLIA
ncbi:MAG: hypothetical protein GC136_05905 [Alphaproteobacteria bacterium]|nr:hypothetical protein [Alphaproteobacteria bacterium]